MHHRADVSSASSPCARATLLLSKHLVFPLESGFLRLRLMEIRVSLLVAVSSLPSVCRPLTPQCLQAPHPPSDHVPLGSVDAHYLAHPSGSICSREAAAIHLTG